MSKFVLALFFGLSFATIAQAQDASVKVTSFYYADQNSHVAELCGHITGVETYPAHVKVTVDYKSNSPANYSVTALSEKFCTTVVTRSGLATVELF